MSIDYALFAMMAMIWGLTWIAIKAGITAVPPVLFAATRYLLVAMVMAVAVKGSWLAFRNGRAPRLLVTGLFNNVATYALIFWGMQYAASGVAGLVNLALMPVALYGFAILFGDERASWRHAAALVLGVAGLFALFWQRSTTPAGVVEAQGLAAVVAATLSYALGSQLSRPLLRQLTPLEVTGAHAIVGAAGLSVLALGLGEATAPHFRALLAPAPLSGLVFLVVFGTFVAYTIYLRLLYAWGAPRAGLYAFVSPVVALLAGAAAFGEPLGLSEAIGAVAMLAGAGLAMPRPMARKAASARPMPQLDERPQ